MLTHKEKQFALFRYRNKNTIASIARELECPSIWVIWAIEEGE